MRYTREMVNDFLKKMKHAVKNENFLIARNINQQDNIRFINEYGINYESQKQMLLELNTSDFSKTEYDKKIIMKFFFSLAESIN